MAGFQTFVTIFLGIFIEAAPFLLLGTLASGLVEVFVNRDVIERVALRNGLVGALLGAILGLAFPVCECGVVPLTRRLFRKGLILPTGVAFLLAAPVINPVVIASTWAAFGWGPVFWGRLGFVLLIATLVGAVFSLAPDSQRLLRPVAWTQVATNSPASPAHRPPSLDSRLRGALTVAADEFFEMGSYLVVGSLLAAAMQTLVPQATLLAVGQGPVSSVIAMLALAFVLSICSTVDAFLALAFVNTFTTGSVLAFLVFGPMVDIKSTLMFLGVFRQRVVFYLILLPLLLTTLVALFLNLNVG